MTNEEKRIWYEWRRMHFRIETLKVNHDELAYHSPGAYAIEQELNELNAQMADLEDANEPWLPELIASEF
jgi:hypothetical protein